MQTLCRNPLATPSVLGIGNGANLGLLLVTILRPDLSESDAVLASFAGAAASAAAIGLLGISQQSRMDRDRLVIGGTVLNSLTASAVLAILFFSGTSNTMLSWTLGRLVNVGWDEGIFALPAIAIGVAASLVIVRQLDPLSLGDEVAASLGVRVGLLQGVTLAVTVLLAGAAVAVAGPIPYIGLVAPHLFPRNRVRSPLARLVLCLFCGATLAALAEWASRMTSGRQLVPLGIWTMAVGAGVFLSLAITRRERAA
jgi:iron complex transport system permease protein